VRFLEYLISDDAQKLFAAGNYEYPVVGSVSLPDGLERWSTFVADTLDVSELGRHNAEAVRVADRAGWR
jgi:iron(III) transport system substrate-binding protein